MSGRGQLPARVCPCHRTFTTQPAAIAAVLYVLAGALFSWAAHSVRGRGFKLAYVPNSPNVVFTGGPYRWFRHPLYLSYTLAWIAGAIAAMSVPLLFTVAAMVAFYVGAAYREEHQLLRSAAGDDYRAYRRQAGVLLPSHCSQCTNPFEACSRPGDPAAPDQFAD